MKSDENAYHEKDPAIDLQLQARNKICNLFTPRCRRVSGLTPRLLLQFCFCCSSIDPPFIRPIFSD